MKRKVILFVLGVLFLAGCAPLSDSVWAPPAALPPGTPLDLNLTAGTFTGSAVSWEGALLTLEVDVDTSRILDINIVNHGDTPLFAYMAFNAILPSIIESNSTGVSTISGATTTSLAVLRAVEEAMEQAGADLAVLRTWIPTVVPGNYYPGVYLGVGTGGFGGNIYVEVTFDEESITHIQVVSHSESPGFGNSALNHLIDQVLFRQSLDVDVVTNGTVTTHAFLAAVAQTIEQATIEPEPEIGPVAEIILPEPEDEVDEPEDEPEELAEEPEDEPADEPEDEAEEPADE
ncbi:MAG: FMN-binding protein, partial [Defluviitaleaceae bacterium]|nr:FMN-binding protein [Defluviitaleaceae bacterium]